MEPGGGLRERKKAATRHALHEAAVRLTLAHGLDRVTVEAIADAATVSRRTFSNYFGNKEQALLYDYRRRLERLVADVRDQPPADPPWKALTAAVTLMLDRLDDEDLERLQVIRRHPELLVEQVALLASLEQGLAEAVAARLPDGDPLTAHLMASTCLTAVRVGSHLWEEHPDLSTLSDQVRLALERTAERFR